MRTPKNFEGQIVLCREEDHLPVSRKRTGSAVRKGVASRAEGSDTERTRLVTSAGLTAHSAMAVAKRDMAVGLVKILCQPLPFAVGTHGHFPVLQFKAGSRNNHLACATRDPPAPRRVVAVESSAASTREPGHRLYLVSTKSYRRVGAEEIRAIHATLLQGGGCSNNAADVINKV